LTSADVLIRLGYDIQFDIPAPVPIVVLLSVHPSRRHDLLEPDELRLKPQAPVEQYRDCFGNICSRFLAPAGPIELQGSTVIADSGELDECEPSARQVPVHELPSETLQFLLASRYCEVDRLQNTATDLFAGTAPGWARVQAICDWVNQKVEFGYHHARATKTALDVYTERAGVCRDFQHLAITFCRCMNIPARYATGYLGDIGVPPAPSPMDFSAWFEVYLEKRWWAFDARHNQRRIGRVLMATGRDAADVAITTSFGSSELRRFTVVTEQMEAQSGLVDASREAPSM
jgi:transglutaminase-like putative cysteine protease